MTNQVTIAPVAKDDKLAVNIAAYVRVSTDKTDQLNSFAAQYTHYRQLFDKDEKVSLVGIYADEGISGTSIAKRDDFNRMIDDCRKGRIDRIVTKSISRFARNTIDCIKTVRELKQLGVSVYFEKEALDTAIEETELRLTVMEMQAQDESVSISKNVRIGDKMRMECGEFKLRRPPYGYDLTNHKLIVNTVEAETVQRIYHEFINGTGITQIVRELNEENVPRSKNLKTWEYKSVAYMLKNETYIGDQRLAKRYRTDTLPFKRVKNRGEKDSYYNIGSHEAIISKSEYEAAQKLRISHCPENAGRPYTDSPFRLKLKCGNCGSSYRKQNRKDGLYWLCNKYNQSSAICGSGYIADSEIRAAFVRMYNKLRQNRKVILQSMLTQLLSLKKSVTDSDDDFNVIEKQIVLLTNQLSVIAQLKQKGFIDQETYSSKSNELNYTLDSLRSKRRLFLNNNKIDKVTGDIKKLIDYLNKAPEKLEAFDDEIFKDIVDVVITDNTNILRFRLYSGLELKEKTERTAK